MKTVIALSLLVLVATPLVGQDVPKPTPAGNVGERKILQRSERGTLVDRMENVRGDTGKWSDEAQLQHVPSPDRKPANQSLDDWVDEMAERAFQPTPSDDNWLVFRTRQFDDNDRVWIESVERKGDEFTIVMTEAIWKGNYFKTFTFYQVLAINLGRLEPGTYKAKWIIKPLEFTRFEDPGKPQDNWPKDEKPAQRKTIDLTASFTVRKPE